MRCSRQLLPCRDENRRPPAANRRHGGCRSRRYSPSDVDFDALAARPLGAHRRAARCETFSDTQERCTVRSSERASGARGVASSYGECIASTRAYRIAYSGCACSDQHCRRCSLSRQLLCSLVHAANRASCTAISFGDGAVHAWGTPPYRTSLLFACSRVRERASDARVYRVVL